MEQRELKPRRTYFSCFHHGVLVHISFFRWFKGTQHIEMSLLQARRKNAVTNDKPLSCPICQIPMKITSVTNDSNLQVDQCLRCNHIWFDLGELEKIKNKGELEKEFPRTQLRSDLLGQEAVYIKNTPKLSFNSNPQSKYNNAEIIPFHPLMIFGLPIEDDRTGVRHTPLATMVLMLACFGTTILGFRNLAYLKSHLFYPTDPFKNHGTNIVISSLMHGNWVHFLGNMYFLFLAGDNIEDQDGPWVFLSCFWFSDLLANFSYLVTHNYNPSLGASGGISGLLAYYTLAFPNNRMQLFFIFRNISISSGLFFVIWMAVQFKGLYSGASNVGFGAHIAGAIGGLLFFFYYKSFKTTY